MAFAKHFTHTTKGGKYQLVGTSSGAGQRKSDVVQVYRDVDTGKLFHREPEDFAMRMKALPDTEALLLAALEAVKSELEVTPRATQADPVITQVYTAIAAAKGGGVKLPLVIGAKVTSAIYDAGGVPVCLIDSMQEASRDEEREMARRIVACVNACEGVSTESLEATQLTTERLQSWTKSADITLLTTQRDELLAALEPFAQAHREWNGTRAMNQFGTALSPAAFREAAEAVAKAKGGGV